MGGILRKTGEVEYETALALNETTDNADALE